MVDIDTSKPTAVATTRQNKTASLREIGGDRRDGPSVPRGAGRNEAMSNASGTTMSVKTVRAPSTVKTTRQQDHQTDGPVDAPVVLEAPYHQSLVI